MSSLFTLNRLPKLKISNEICFVANILLYVHTQFKYLFDAFDLQTNNVILIFNIK